MIYGIEKKIIFKQIIYNQYQVNTSIRESWLTLFIYLSISYLAFELLGMWGASYPAPGAENEFREDEYWWAS